MEKIDAETLLQGAVAGIAASIVQALVGKSEEILLLPPDEDANIAPRLVDRLAKRADWDPPVAVEWTLGTAFHLGYGAAWGAAYAAIRERHPVSPLLGGAVLGGVIYGITFTPWGGAVQTGVERPAHRRTDRMTFVAASVAFAFGLATSYGYEALREERLGRESGTPPEA